MTSTEKTPSDDLDTGAGAGIEGAATPAALHHAFPGLNGMRAAGAIMVVATHTAFDTGKVVDGPAGALLGRMNAGVTIFFVLSGFLLSRPFFLAAVHGARQPSVRRYFWKRAIRILPLYWFVVVVVWATEPDNRGVITPVMWVRNLTLTQLYWPDLLPTGLTQMWSLATEVAFYVLLPLIVLLLLGRARRFSERRALVLLGVVAAAGVAWQATVGPIPGREGHFEQWLPGYLPWFCIGMAFAVVSAADTVRTPRHVLVRMAQDPAACWLAAFLVFAISATPIAGPLLLLPPTHWEAAMRVTLFAVFGGLLVLPLVFGDLERGRIRQFCNHRIPFFLGEISYGIFCVHLIVLHEVFRRTDYQAFSGNWGAVFALTMAGTIALATLTYYLIEVPAMRLRRFGPRESTGRASDTAPTSSH